MRTALPAAVLLLTACTNAGGPAVQHGASEGRTADEGSLPVPPIGSNPIFRAAPAAAPGHELIVTDLNLPANAVGERHYHPWEEYLYVIAGSAILDIDGTEPRVLEAGDSFVIPPKAPHTPRAGPAGVRAIVVRLHDEGDPVAVSAPQ